MGCLLSVTGNACTNFLDIDELGNVILCSSLKKGSSICSSTFYSSRRKGPCSTIDRQRVPRKKTGYLVADALKNIEKAHTFRHGECYMCNYKNKKCSGVCIHREVFTSVKPGFYSHYYDKNKVEGTRDTEKVNRSSARQKNSKQLSHRSKRLKNNTCKSSNKSQERSKVSKSSSKSRSKRSIRSVSAFPGDGNQYTLGIKPQPSFQKRPKAPNDTETSEDIPAPKSRLNNEDNSVISDISQENDYYKYPLTASCSSPPSSFYEDIISQSNLARGALTASDFGLVKHAASSNDSEPEVKRTTLRSFSLHENYGSSLVRGNPFAESTRKPLYQFATGSERIKDSKSNQNVSFRTKKFERKSIYLPDVKDKKSANAQMENAVTPVYLAAQEGHLDVLQYLIDGAGGRLDLRAKDGMAPIHASAQMGCLSCLKWMVKSKGVDINLRDGDGATPLHFASSRGHVETVRWLLKNGANIVLDKFGKSPVDDAEDNSHLEVLEMLTQHRTSPDSAADSDSCESSSTQRPCTCHRMSKQMRKGSASSMTDSCSSCQSDCQSGNTSDSGLNHEPFFLHPPSPVAKNNNNNTKKIFPQTENGNHINNNNSKAIDNNTKEGREGKVSSPYNPLAELKEASDKHKMKNGSLKRGEKLDEAPQPFYLHKPDEVSYHRVQELFEESKAKETPRMSKRLESKNQGSHLANGKHETVGNGIDRSLLQEHKPSKISPSLNERSMWQDSVDQGGERRKESRSSSSEDESVTSDLSSFSEGGNSEGNGHVVDRKAENEVKKERTEVGGRSPRASKERIEISKREQQVIQGLDDLIADYDDGACSEKSDEMRATSCQEPSKCGDQPPSTSSSSPEFAEHKTVSRTASEPAQNKSPPPPPPPPPVGTSTEDIDSNKNETKEEDSGSLIPPPPPPPTSSPSPPPSMSSTINANNSASSHKPGLAGAKMTMPTISVTDLQSVQLRKTESKILKPTTVPLKIHTEQDLVTQRNDVIAELKMGVDIDGIKKLKTEKIKEEIHIVEKEKEELKKQFVVDKFVEKVPEVDGTGNPIPQWKRQMLAKKAAEKAKKEAEEKKQKELEERRLQSIPAWKRQLLAKKEEERQRNPLSVPKVEEIKKIKVGIPQTRFGDKQTEDSQRRPSSSNTLPLISSSNKSLPPGKSDTHDRRTISNAYNRLTSKSLTDSLTVTEPKSSFGHSVKYCFPLKEVEIIEKSSSPFTNTNDSFKY